MAQPALRRPTYEDLCALPHNVKGEILDGVLYTQPRPRFRHMRATATLTGRIQPQFDLGNNGAPGLWWILPEPGIELDGSIECSPDVAGWRRDRLPIPPAANEPITIAPDWVCEILSPSTRDYDERIKKPFYAKHKVKYFWLVDPEAHVIIAYQLHKGDWIELGTWKDTVSVRIEPFVELELNLAEMWV